MNHRNALRYRQAAPTVLLAAALGLIAAAPRSAPSAGVATVELADRLLPRPQYMEVSGPSAVLDTGWLIALDTSDERYAFAGEWFNEHVEETALGRLSVVDGRQAGAGAQRIVIGDPAVHTYVRDALGRRGRGLPASVGDEGYVLAVYGGERPEIIVAAHAPNGAFYGVVTLLQLLTDDGEIPGVLVVDYPEHALRGTYEPDSAVMGWEDGRNVFTDRQRDYIDWLAAHKGNTLFLVDNGDFFQDESTWAKAYEELFAYARQRFVEPVPRVCSISTVGPFPFELYEGWPIVGEPFVFDEQDMAVAKEPFVDLAPNGGFELDEDGDGVPDGWTVSNRPGAAWSIDETTFASGQRSMRLDIPEPTSDSSQASLRFSYPDPEPDSYYCLWSRARAQDIGAVPPQLTMYAIDSARQVAVLQSDVTESTEGWIHFGTCIQTPADPIALTVYSRIQSSGSGTFWIDDVRLSRVDSALLNVIRGSGTDVTVTDETGRAYVPGTDYEVIDGTTHMRLLPTLEPLRIRRLAEGDIASGQQVLVGYDAYLFSRLSRYWSSAPCVACDELYTRYYEPAIDRIVERLHPRIVNIDADEIRGFYRDSRVVGRFASNAEAIAYWANRIRRYLQSRDPSARLWIWDDMVSPYHNGGVEDYQVHYGGRPGRMAEATEYDLIDKSIIMGVWWYSNERISQMWHSIDYFGAKGYDVSGSPWLDPDNIVRWSEMLVGRPHAVGGVETNWGTPWQSAHEVFADHFWNTRYRMAVFDSFEIDADGDSVPDGWHVTGRIDYSTDGSMSHGQQYASFPVAAVGILSTTVALERPGIPVRPDTRYLLSAYLRRDADADPAPRFRIDWRDSDGALVSSDPCDFAGLDEAYAPFEAELRSPKGASSASIVLDASGAGAWVDDVQWKEETRLRAGVTPVRVYVPSAQAFGREAAE